MNESLDKVPTEAIVTSLVKALMNLTAIATTVKTPETLASAWMHTAVATPNTGAVTMTRAKQTAAKSAEPQIVYTPAHEKRTARSVVMIAKIVALAHLAKLVRNGLVVTLRPSKPAVERSTASRVRRPIHLQ
jgi:hypothetical protein